MSMLIECPVCGAEFSVPRTVSVTECPYCGTVFETATKTKLQHFYFPLMKEDPYDMLMKFLERQYGVPDDLRVSSTLAGRELHVVPVHFFHLHGRGVVRGKSRKLGRVRLVVEEVMDIGIPAVDGKFQRLLANYPFPLRGKRFYDESVKSMGTYYEPRVSYEEARREAEERLAKELRKEASQSVRRVEDLEYQLFKVEYKGLVHYPVWELTYRYEGESYAGYVDGATGVVILAEHPLSIKGKVSQALLAALFVLAGVASSLIVASQSWGSVSGIGALLGILAGVVSALPLLTRSIRRKVRASEIRVIREEESKIPLGLTSSLVVRL